MSLTLDENSARFQIRSYTPGEIRVNDLHFKNSIIVSPTKIIDKWPPQSVKDLNQKDFLVFLELMPAILLIGTGATHEILPVELYGELINAGIGVEVMNTFAACRTYNALTAEERNVAAALIV
jgi:uncharacterized protein